MAAQDNRSSASLDHATQAEWEQFHGDMLGELSTLDIPSETGESLDALISEAGNNQRQATGNMYIDQCVVSTGSVNQRPSSGHARLAEPIWPDQQGSSGGDECEGRRKQHEEDITGILQLSYEQEHTVRV